MFSEYNGIKSISVTKRLQENLQTLGIKIIHGFRKKSKGTQKYILNLMKMRTQLINI